MIPAISAEMWEFDQYVEQTKMELPESLRSGSNPPSTWTGTASQWEQLGAAARQSFAFDAAREFCLAVANGWYPGELAQGRLSPGASVTMGGLVVRPLPSSLPQSVEEEAQEVLRQMHALSTSVSGVLMLNLERAAAGGWTGRPLTISDSLDVARAAVRQRQAEIEAAKRRDAEEVSITVLHSFRAIGGKQYAPGTYSLDPDEVDDLRVWQQRMEVQAATRRWDAPPGFTPETWPPFVLT